MDNEAIVRRRIHNLRLTGSAPRGPDEVLRWMGAVQSQDYGPAKWSLDQRTGGSGDAALDKAFDDGVFLRTHILRPTWHFVLPADIGWMLELTGPRVQAANAHRYRELGLNESDRRRSTTVIARALGTQPLTRKEIGGVLGKAGIDPTGQRLPHMLMHAELEGVICSGPRNGKQHTYALLEERAPNATSFSADEALAELTKRYFTSHGPATVKDFGWWSSLTGAQIKKGLEIVGPNLKSEVVDGVTFWFAPSPLPRRPSSPRADLLQAFDECIVGYTESRSLFDLPGATKGSRDTPAFKGIVLLDGRIAGHWKRRAGKDTSTIEVGLYTPFDDRRIRALQRAADRYGRFLGSRATVVATDA